MWKLAVAGVPGDPLVSGNTTHVLAYRARFRGMKMKVLGVDQIVKCEMVIELRRLSVRSQLFGLYYASNAKRVNENGYSLRDAKTVVEAMFAEKVNDWQEVTAGDPLSTGERK